MVESTKDKGQSIYIGKDNITKVDIFFEGEQKKNIGIACNEEIGFNLTLNNIDIDLKNDRNLLVAARTNEEALCIKKEFSYRNKKYKFIEGNKELLLTWDISKYLLEFNIMKEALLYNCIDAYINRYKEKVSITCDLQKDLISCLFELSLINFKYKKVRRVKTVYTLLKSLERIKYDDFKSDIFRLFEENKDNIFIGKLRYKLSIFNSISELEYLYKMLKKIFKSYIKDIDNTSGIISDGSINKKNEYIVINYNNEEFKYLTDLYLNLTLRDLQDENINVYLHEKVHLIDGCRLLAEGNLNLLLTYDSIESLASIYGQNE